MKHLYGTMTGLLILAAALSGCPEPENTVVITEEENESNLSVAVGAFIQLHLPSNATTGYAWSLTGLDRAMVCDLGSEYIAPDSDLAGAPGEEVWRFLAIAPGECLLELEYRRPWDPEEAPPADTFRLSITVLAGD